MMDYTHFKLTREQVERACSADGVILDPSWDGKSEDVPVQIPNHMQPWTWYRGTASLSRIREFFIRELMR